MDSERALRAVQALAQNDLPHEGRQAADSDSRDAPDDFPRLRDSAAFESEGLLT